MTPGRLRTLVLHVSNRCDQSCAHCAIWRPRPVGGRARLSDAARLTLIEQARALGARETLLTGGEPFLHPGLEGLCREARRLGLKVWVATNGLSLGRAPWVLEVVDELFVSLEGPEDLHDRVRGPGAWRRLRDAIGALRARPGRPRITARHAWREDSLPFWRETARSAEEIGVDALSLLPIDTTSDAFGGDPKGRLRFAASPATLAAFRDDVRAAARDGWPSILAEGPAELLAQADRMEGRSAPRCNAPEWSIVVETDGTVRPCFFQPSFDVWNEGSDLGAIRSGDAAARALSGLSPANGVCASCVCPKWRDAPIRAWARSVRDAVASVSP